MCRGVYETNLKDFLVWNILQFHFFCHHVGTKRNVRFWVTCHLQKFNVSTFTRYLSTKMRRKSTRYNEGNNFPLKFIYSLPFSIALERETSKIDTKNCPIIETPIGSRVHWASKPARFCCARASPEIHLPRVPNPCISAIAGEMVQEIRDRLYSLYRWHVWNVP